MSKGDVVRCQQCGKYFTQNRSSHILCSQKCRDAKRHGKPSYLQNQTGKNKTIKKNGKTYAEIQKEETVAMFAKIDIKKEMEIILGGVE